MRILWWLLTCLVLAWWSSATAAPPGDKAASVTYQSGEWDSGNHYYPFVFYDEAAKDYKMFYSASTRAETNESMWGQRITGMRVSKDAVSWSPVDNSRQPVLYARKLMQGEILNPDDAAAVFDSVYAIGPCVIKDGPLYKMWYTGWGGETELAPGSTDGRANKINFRIGYATSPDGRRWNKFSGFAGSRATVGAGAPGEPDCKGAGQPFVIKEGSTYRMWYEGFDGKVWQILNATSPDGLKWTKKGVAVGQFWLFSGLSAIPPRWFDTTGARNPVVVKRNGKYEMWYQGKSKEPPYYHVCRAVSDDGVGKWSKLIGEVTLHPPAPVTGNEEIFVDSIIVLPDGSCQVFFSKENTVTSQASDGPNEVKRFANYTEVVNP
ncbi:MAG: hypothetical protein Q7T82_10315 [Armatimonadota bacterium]|nr:hypothetical protein [Armatimonadota bacterium]